MYVIEHKVVKVSVNVTFDDTKLPSIQTEESSERLKFDDLTDSESDGKDQPEVVADDNNNDNDDDDRGEGGGNNDNIGDTTDTQDDPSTPPCNNSGGVEEGSTSRTPHQQTGDPSRSQLPRTRVWN